MKHAILTALFFFGTASALRAETVTRNGHPYPKTLEAEGRTWTLTGTGFYKHKGLFAVFTGGLYQGPGGEGRKLVFTYSRKLKADVLRDQGLRVLREAHGAEALQERQAALDRITQAYQAVGEGDQYALTVLPGEGVRLALNGTESVFIPDADFGMWYLGIWLGDKPMSVPLRDELLKSEGT